MISRKVLCASVEFYCHGIIDGNGDGIGDELDPNLECIKDLFQCHNLAELLVNSFPDNSVCLNTPIQAIII